MKFRLLKPHKRACQWKAGLLILAGLISGCQTAPKRAGPESRASEDSKRLDGVWQKFGTEYRGVGNFKDALTPYGQKRYAAVDFARSPAIRCLPPGPFIPFTLPQLFQIVQSSEAVAFVFEGFGAFRLVSLSETSHPPDISEYPEWMGHSIGKFDGTALTVDTVGIDERTWLASVGVEHSIQLHLTERFERIGTDTLKYTWVIEDPVFFVKPLTGEFLFKKQQTRIMASYCQENERNVGRVKPMHPGDPRVNWGIGHRRLLTPSQ